MSETIENKETTEVTKSIEELLENMFVVIAKKNTSKDLRDYMQGVYEEKQMVDRKVDKILKGQIILNTLDESELGVWCVYLYEFVSKEFLKSTFESSEEKLKEQKLVESINPIYYFPEYKIEKIRQYYDIDAKKTKTDRMVFRNVVKVKNQYMCPFVSNYDIDLYMSNGFLGYDTAMQRDPKIINVKGMLLRQPNVTWKSVDEIGKIIYDDNFTANLITLNILKTSKFNEKGIIYDEKEKTLTILKTVFITDGFHRILACTDAVAKANESGKTLEYGFMVSITNFTVREAQEYVSREFKRNPISVDYSKTLEKNDNNIFIDALNESGEMKGKIANTIDEIGDNTKYTTYGILNSALKIADIDLSISARNDDYLETFSTVFDTVIGEYLKKYDYTDLKALRKESIALNYNVFVGYVALSKELLGRDNKEVKRIIKDMIRSGELNLDKTHENWREMEMYKKNPKSLRVIFDYFKKIVELHDIEKGEE